MTLRLSPGHSVVLASSSPRRRELLSGCGLQFEIEVPRKAEEQLAGETPRDMVARLALQKATEIADQRREAWVIGADTTVVLDGEALGKPRDAADAVRMLERMQGRWHEVMGGIAIVNRARAVEHVESHLSQVRMAQASVVRIERYVASGEPMDKAGGYAIQGLGAHLVESLNGSYTNVVGLNLTALIEALSRLGALQDV